MRFTMEQSGNDRYLLYSFEQTDIVETMSFGQITNNNIPGLAASAITQMDSARSVRYKITSLVALEEYLKKPVRKAELLRIFFGILGAAAESREYMIDPDVLIFDKKYIFLDPETLDVSLICLPVMNRNWLQGDLQSCLWKLAAKTPKDKSESREYVSDLMEILDPENPLSISDMISSLKAFAPASDETGEDAADHDRNQAEVDDSRYQNAETPEAPQETAQATHSEEEHGASGKAVATTNWNQTVIDDSWYQNEGKPKGSQKTHSEEEHGASGKAVADHDWNVTVIDDSGYQNVGKPKGSQKTHSEEEHGTSGKAVADHDWNVTVIDDSWYQNAGNPKGTQKTHSEEEHGASGKAVADHDWNVTVIDENGWRRLAGNPEEPWKAVQKTHSDDDYPFFSRTGADHDWNLTAIDEDRWHPKAENTEDPWKATQKTHNEEEHAASDEAGTDYDRNRMSTGENNAHQGEEKKEETRSMFRNILQKNTSRKSIFSRGNAGSLKNRQDGTASGGESVPCLIRVKGNEVVRIEGTVFQIGSDYGYCDYQIKNRTVSDIHAQIIRHGKNFFIKDMDSKHKTFLDDDPIPSMEAIELKPGMEIRFGTERFVFTLS